MATIQEILDKINTSKSNNINNNSFIDLMRQISGNPEDGIQPVNDANSIYGHIVQMYTELFNSSSTYTTIVDEIETIKSVFEDLDEINSVDSIKRELESIFADKLKLDSIFADKNKLDSLFFDKITLDSLFADKAKLDSLFTDKAKLDSLFANKFNIDTVSENITDVNTVSDNIENVNLVGEDITNVNLVSEELVNIGINADNITNIAIAGSNIFSINTVANATNLSDIIRVAADLNSLDVNGIADITIVANDLVLGVDSNIITVSESIDNVNITGNDIDNINIVGTDIANVDIVSTNINNINITANDIVSINTVSSNIANVNTVLDEITNVNTVSGSIANVNTVASNIVGLNSIVSNMPEILLADDNAAIATTKALESSDSAAASLQSSLDSADSAALFPNHIADTTNPHEVTKIQVGLEFAENTADIDKIVASAGKLTSAVNISLSGDVSGSVSFDGSNNVNIATIIGANSVTLGTDTTGNYVAGLTQGTGISVTGSVGEGWSPTVSLANVGTAGTYKSVTTDAQGRVIAGTNPTTLSGYGITDATPSSHIGSTGTAHGIATTSVNGFMSSTDKSKLDGIAANANNYVLPEATSTAIGGVKVSDTTQTVAANAVTATTAKTYAVQLDASNNAVVNVPWVDTNTVYTHPTSGVAAGTYRSVTVNTSGHITAGTNPTTVSGYGLTDVYTKTENNTSLALKVNNSEKGVANGIATLDTNGKVVLTQIPDSVLGQLEYIGIWNFATLPTATEKGQYWIASVAGNGYEVGDWAVWNGSAFDKVDNTDAVATVAGRTGNVVLTKSDVGLGLVDNTADASKNVLSATKWAAARTITLSGDVAGSANIDGSANVTITTTVQPNSVELGTDTTGNYVADVTAGTGISISGTAGEGWSPTITNTAPNVTTNITTTHNATNVVVNSSDGADGTINGATQTLAGVMTASDKSKLDGITTGATANTGTVTSIATSGAITGGTITSTGTISHSTADGYLHVPATGTINSGKVLTAGATAGSLSWTEIPSAPVASVAGKTGAVTLVKGDVGLGSVDNTADLAKNVLSATKLTTARTINGVAFDGTSNITVSDSTAVKLTGDQTIAGVKTFSSTIITKPSSVVANVTSLGAGTASPIRITPINVGSTFGYIPWMSTSVMSSSGYRTHNSIGTYRPGATWADSGIYLATGGSDSSPTEAYLFKNGRTISNTAGDISLIGNALTASTLATARTIATSGDVVGTATSFNGSANITIPMTLANSGVTAGTYSKMTVDAKGRVTAGFTQTMEDIPDATFKRSVKAATTANITLSAPQTIDGVALVAGDRVLVKNQTTTSQNGIYVVAAAAWTRSLDADSASKIASALVAVDTGTVNGGKLFDNDFKITDTLDTTAMQWSMNLDDGSLLTSGSTSIGTVRYNGTTAVAGQFDGGTTTPTGTVRLNYGGYFYPSYINLTGSADTTITSSHVFVETGSDGYVRPKTLANFKTEMFASPTLVTPNIGVATGTSFNSITGLSTVVGTTSGTAAVGTSTTVARADHVHPIQTTITGNAGTATTLATARTINGVSFNGSANITIADSTKVALTGDQTIAGIKTFSSSPIVPTPTTDTQAANKAYVDGRYGGFKNYIINGNFDVWQRGISQTTSGYGSDDRWFNMNLVSTKTHTQVACTNTERALFNALYFSRTVVQSVAGANNYVQKVQYIEDITRLSGKTVTLSFWAKADTAKNIGFRVGYNYGSGGTPSNGVDTGVQLIGLTTTWQKKSIVLPITSLVGKTLGTEGAHTSSLTLIFVFDEGSSINYTGVGQQSGTFDIAQVQLEEGSVATPFENRPYSLELSLCQRYYNGFIRIGFYNSESYTKVIGGSITFSNQMRVTPTMGLVAGMAVTYQNLNAIGTEYYSTVGAGLWNNGQHYASAEL